MSDTYIEGLEEIAERIARKHGTGGWQTLDDMIAYALAVIADPAIPAHIPAYKALQEEVERLNSLRDCYRDDAEWKSARIADLEAQLSASLDARIAREREFQGTLDEFSRQLSALQAGEPVAEACYSGEESDYLTCLLLKPVKQGTKLYTAAPTHPVSANQPDGGKVPASRPAAKRYRRWIDCIQDLLKAGVPKHARQKAETVIQEIENSIKYGGCKCADASPSAPIAEGDK